MLRNIRVKNESEEMGRERSQTLEWIEYEILMLNLGGGRSKGF